MEKENEKLYAIVTYNQKTDNYIRNYGLTEKSENAFYVEIYEMLDKSKVDFFEVLRDSNKNLLSDWNDYAKYIDTRYLGFKFFSNMCLSLGVDFDVITEQERIKDLGKRVLRGEAPLPKMLSSSHDYAYISEMGKEDIKRKIYSVATKNINELVDNNFDVLMENSKDLKKPETFNEYLDRKALYDDVVKHIAETKSSDKSAEVKVENDKKVEKAF